MHRTPQLGQKPRRSPKAPTSGAAEGYKMLGMTIFATHPQETMFQPPAFEVILKLPLHIAH